ncbi:hypothetical protein OAO42_01325 [Candidatus Izimaplasma bacterium]|nr:hypothetical protein [Candidatus Izimaplasma bacterium]
MKKLFLVFLMTILLTGCGLFDRGNYEKDRTGFVIDGNLIVSYHTNSVGELDIFMIDQIMTYFEALEYAMFDVTELSNHITLSSYVTPTELDNCGIETTLTIPKFFRIGDKSYFYNMRDNGYCTYDEYIFHEDGFTDEVLYEVDETSPIEKQNIIRFKNVDFTINTFNDILFIENIYFSSIQDRWVKEIIEVLPMSYTQAGDSTENLSDIMEEIKIIENYVLVNQSVNLLKLKEDYRDEDVNNIWHEDTIEALGRDHEVIKKVRIKNTQEILDIINDTLSRLGMFQ